MPALRTAAVSEARQGVTMNFETVEGEYVPGPDGLLQ
jgi:hypothetical protein